MDGRSHYAAILLLSSLATGLTGCAMGPLRLTTAFGGRSTNTLETKLTAARLCERQGQDKQAIEIYEALLGKDAPQQVVLHRLGVLAAKRADYEQADEYLKKATEAGPATVELLSDVGYCFYLQDRLEDAEEALKKALSKDPHYAAAHTNMGLVLGQLDRMEESLDAFRKGGSEAEAHANVAYIHAQRKELAQAQMHYSQALKADPNLTVAAEALLQVSGINGSDSRLAAVNASAGGESAKTTGSKTTKALALDRGMGLVDIVDVANRAPRTALGSASPKANDSVASTTPSKLPEANRPVEKSTMPLAAVASKPKPPSARHIDRDASLPIALTASSLAAAPANRSATDRSPKVAGLPMPTPGSASRTPWADPPQTPAATPPVVGSKRDSAIATLAKSNTEAARPAAESMELPEFRSIPNDRIPNITQPSVLPDVSHASGASGPSQVVQAAHTEVSSHLPAQSQPQSPVTESYLPSPPQPPSAQPLPSAGAGKPATARPRRTTLPLN